MLLTVSSPHWTAGVVDALLPPLAALAPEQRFFVRKPAAEHPAVRIGWE